MGKIIDGKLSRRRFLRGVGTVAIGAAGMTAAASGLDVLSHAEAKAVFA